MLEQLDPCQVLIHNDAKKFPNLIFAEGVYSQSVTRKPFRKIFVRAKKNTGCFINI